MSLPWRRRRQDQQPRQSSAWGQSLRGPERAYYQRLAGDYSQLSSNGKLTLTAMHVLFTSVIGADVAVPLQDVQEVRNQKIRRFHVGGHDSQLVIATRSGEIGFLVADPAAWAGAIRDRLPAAEGLPPGARRYLTRRNRASGPSAHTAEFVRCGGWCWHGRVRHALATVAGRPDAACGGAGS